MELISFYIFSHISCKKLATWRGNINEKNKREFIHNWRGNILSTGNVGKRKDIEEKKPFIKINIASTIGIFINIYIYILIIILYYNLQT